MGPLFEEIVRQYIWKLTYNNFNKIGKWWHKDQEIDLVALNENKKQIAFFECKWKTLGYNQSLKILKELKEKTPYVKWFNKQRKEQYGLIAKKIENKKDLRKEGFLVYDLEDWK